MDSLTVSDFEVEVMPNLEDEIRAIGSEYIGGSLYTGRSFARAARCIIENRYQGQEIVDEVNGGHIAFPTQERFLEYLSQRFGMSISSMKEHLTNYRRLVIGLKMPWESALKASMNCPGSITHMLPEMAHFDRAGNVESIVPTKVIALPTVDRDTFTESANQTEYSIPKIAEFINETARLSNPKEAAKHMRNILGKNTISFTLNEEGNIRAHYEENSIDTDTGEARTIRKGDIVWQPYKEVDEDDVIRLEEIDFIPLWVQSHLIKILHAELV